MRKRKSIKIDDREITVYELKVRDIIDLAGLFDGGSPVEILRSELHRITDLSPDDLTEMAPSELRQILDVAREVNADFLAAARAVGLTKIVEDLIHQVGSTFGGLLAGSSKPATPDASTTAGVLSR